MSKLGTSCKLLKAQVPFVVDQLSQRASNLSVTVTFPFTSAVTHLTNLNFLNVLKFQKQGRNVVHWSHDILHHKRKDKKVHKNLKQQKQSPFVPNNASVSNSVLIFRKNNFHCW
jgi:hypothetical protein